MYKFSVLTVLIFVPIILIPAQSQAQTWRVCISSAEKAAESDQEALGLAPSEADRIVAAISTSIGLNRPIVQNIRITFEPAQGGPITNLFKFEPRQKYNLFNTQ
ncbi:MAG: hypothetical protein GY875_13225 [Gammaproteobacteria bacterium]|nr:hypothetical protein [Gammaproteobacteria bacterium]